MFAITLPKEHLSMYRNIPSTLVRFNLHMRRDHVQRLAQLAQLLVKKKGRDVRLAEAIELALVAGLHWKDADLLDLAVPDNAAPYWLQVGPLKRPGSVIVPHAIEL